MALAPLVTAADLSARGITIADPSQELALIASASGAVRDAAGSAITRSTATISLTGSTSKWLPIPVSPVRSVTSVKIDGTAISDWRLIDFRLWRRYGWGCLHEPSVIEVVLDFGLDEVPADIVDLACSLVAAGAAATTNSYDPQRGVSSTALDDYRESRATGDTEVVSPMLLPESTREWLAARFGGGVHVTGSY